MGRLSEPPDGSPTRGFLRQMPGLEIRSIRRYDMTAFREFASAAHHGQYYGYGWRFIEARSGQLATSDREQLGGQIQVRNHRCPRS